MNDLFRYEFLRREMDSFMASASGNTVTNENEETELVSESLDVVDVSEEEEE